MSSSASQSVETVDLALTFAALGDRRRLALVEKLYSANAQSVSALCEGMDVSRQAVSKHLKILSEARLVSSERSGRETLYSLEKRKLEEANAFLAHVGEKWDAAFARLNVHLASPPAKKQAKTGSTPGGSDAGPAVAKTLNQKEEG